MRFLIRPARIVGLLLLLHGAPARAASAAAMVLVGRAASDDGSERRLASRLEGELAADGFVASIEAPGTATLDEALLAKLARLRGAPIGAGLWIADHGTAIELALVDPATGRTFHQRIQAASSDSAPEVLARRGVDLLQASLLDFALEGMRARSETVPPAAQADRSLAERHRSMRVSFDAGAGVLTSFQGVGPSLVSLARLGVLVDPQWRIGVAAAGLGTGTTVVGPTGSAQIDQDVILAEAMVSPWSAAPVRPRGSFGVGAYAFHATGSAVPPDVAKTGFAWAFAAEAGAGVVVSVADSLEVSLDLDALFTAPGVSVRFAGEDLARAGRPSLLGTLAIGGRL